MYMKIEEDVKLDFNDVLIRPKRSKLSSRSEVNLEREIYFPISKQTWKGVPIIAANMDTVGTYDVYKVLSKHKIITAFHKFYTLRQFEEMEGLDPDYFAISTGISEDDFIKLTEIMDRNFGSRVKFICIDVANGYMEKLVEFCKKVREMYPNKILIAGNVVSREVTEELILNGGIDIVKVGIGPGSACLTRTQTGVGMPQLSAIMECADAAHGVNGFIIGDGGITCPGDLSKGFGGGADFIMIGGQFAGHDENPGEIIVINNEKYKEFYGMSSETAMKKHYGKMDKYRSSEGRSIKIKYKGPLETTVLNYLGGLRSTCTYINAKNIKNMSKCTTFIKTNRILNTVFV
uniref:GMP reductase n=1 Tax=viral metagenome TaxID=1070528 RepID=A0A6C0BRV3_9ZZZZ